MEIWRLQCVDEDEQPVHYFENFHDIKPSLMTSYSGCIMVEIKMTPQTTGGPVFTVDGFVPTEDDNVPFRHTFKTERLWVHDKVTHL